MTQNEKGPSLINNLHMKFASDQAKTVALSCPQGFKGIVLNLTLAFDHATKINKVLALIIHNLHVKFESDRANTVVCIMPTRFYIQSAKVDLNLWLREPKINRVLPLIIHN